MTTQALNSLANASSAYLRSAMHQPIRWHEWGEEAFATAKRENKPMLLDIGAVWCHWCHVMDRESYDDPETARIVNENFIAVKVDRDERPDVDSRYQLAVSSLTGQGGWPLTAFLTPDGKPFYGGTYFPPDDQYGRPSFKRVLLTLAAAFREKRGDIEEQATMVVSAIERSEGFAGKSSDFNPKVIPAIVESAIGMYDARNGGFGQAPKFPHPATLDLLIDQYTRTGNEQLREIFTTTLRKMAQGGVYDQLAGGFHRYSVDERWVVPHFEKMSYDNSELLKNYVHAFQAVGDPFFADVARDIIRWMDEWLSDRERGGFYSSQDADYSMDDDGDYFTWTLDEAKRVLSGEEVQVASLRYDINEVGEMHHNPAKNVLYIRASIEEIARRTGLETEPLKQALQSAKEKMYSARKERPTPYVDKTVYVGWNALCVSAYLQAARVLELEETRHFALRSLDRILAQGWNMELGLRHVIAYSEAQEQEKLTAGLLDDYAFTAVACLDAYETTSDLSYFNFARRIADMMIERFYDAVSGGFVDTPSSRADAELLGVLGTRRRPFQDSPTPAGNSVAVITLLRLHAYTDDASYREKAEHTLEVFAGVAGQYGIFAATYGLAAVHFANDQTQVVVIGNDARADALKRRALGIFAANKAVLQFPPNEVVPQNLPPALAETIPSLAHTSGVAVLCSGRTCQPPVSDPAELSRTLLASLQAKA
jgi:uncharacterized protein